MEKVIFKGTINGQNFDSIEAYNAEIYRLKEEGCTNITANASTQIINTSDECNCEECCNTDSNKCKCEKDSVEADVSNNINFYPLFDTNKHYLDKFVTSDHDQNVNMYNDLKQWLADQTRIIVAGLRSVPQKDRISHLAIYDNILESIKVDRADTSDSYLSLNGEIEEIDRKISELKMKRESLNTRLDVLNDCHPIMDELQKFYENLHSATQDLIVEEDSTRKPLPQRAVTPAGLLHWLDSLFKS